MLCVQYDREVDIKGLFKDLVYRRLLKVVTDILKSFTKFTKTTQLSRLLTLSEKSLISVELQMLPHVSS